MNNKDYISLQKNLNKQLGWFLSVKSKGLETYDGQHAPLEQANLISSCYKLIINKFPS